jgi:hypothetical protein
VTGFKHPYCFIANASFTRQFRLRPAQGLAVLSHGFAHDLQLFILADGRGFIQPSILSYLGQEILKPLPAFAWALDRSTSYRRSA